MLWLTFSSAFALPHLEGKHCGTLFQLQEFDPPMLRQEDVPKIQGNKSTKAERNSVCSCNNSVSSDNFIIRWGSGVSLSDAEELLEAFELAWDVEVNQMGYLQPVATDQYLFNVYIGDSGGGAPSSYGAAGYFSSDDEGYPMIVIAEETVGSEYVAQTVAHEFFHAIQGRVYRYDYDETGPSAWYWEATANWAEGQVYPGRASMAVFLIGYSFLPHLPVNYFNYPDSGTVDEYHQYGAFIFPLHLTEVEADIELVWNSWNDQGSERDPMLVLNDYLGDYGTDINQSWLNHLAHMSVWDYQDGHLFEQTLDAYQDHYDEGENLPAVDIRGETNGWVNGPSDLQPMRYGHNMIYVSDLSMSEVTFGIRGDAEGTSGSLAEYGATVTRKIGSQIDYFPLEFTNNEAQITIPSVSPDDEFYFTVGAWTEAWNSSIVYSESFPFQYYIGSETEVNEPSPEPDTGTPNEPDSGYFDDEKGGIFGCSAVDPLSVWAILGVLGVLSHRRRRD